MNLEVVLIAAGLTATFGSLLAVFILRHTLHTLRGRVETVEASLFAIDEKAGGENGIVPGLYDNVLEADLTNDRLLGANCEHICRLLHLPPEASYSACIEAILAQMVKPEYHAIYRNGFDREQLLSRFALGEHNYSLEFEERADLVRYRWTRAFLSVSQSKGGGAVRLSSYVKDIHAEKERERSLLQAATTDSLTGLLNRQAMEQRIRKILSEPHCPPVGHTLLIVDIDRFKQVNDHLGHAGGDEILRLVARLLRSCFRENDVVGRYGGDEFLILVNGCVAVKPMTAKARELLDAAAALGGDIPISLSIGMALFPSHADGYDDLFRDADAALYWVKEHGRNGWHLFSDPDDPAPQIKD